MSFLDLVIGTDSDRTQKKYIKLLPGIHKYINEYENIKDNDLIKKTEELKTKLKEGKSLDEILPEAFAIVAVTSKRTTGLSPYDVQLIGGITLHKGSIAEMRTGEGKTLVAVAPAYLNALNEKPVHIITVNDYLARRDAVWMGQIYSALGLTVGVINSQNNSYIYDPAHLEKDSERDEKGGYKIVYDFLRESSKKETYACDIVYGTSNEFAFDYLRDNIAYDSDQLTQRGFGYAIVDEVDSVLIDEARSPLIISSPANIPASEYTEFAKFSNNLIEGEDYTIDEKTKSVSLMPSGVEKFEKATRKDNVYVEGGQRAIHMLQNALKAKSLFKKNKQYLVQNDTVVIIDEFTGRLQLGRQWSDGLHQAIEAKEGVTINQENRTYASVTFQNFFRMYEKLSGMSGTAISSEEEFFKVYGMPVISISTHHTVKRKDNKDLIYQTKIAKLKAIVEHVKEINEKGQPVLIGTASIEHNEDVSKALEKSKIKHNVLNAKNHEEEGNVIASAGKLGAVTVATNLAGRGVDIKLGGPTQEEIEKNGNKIRDLGGLYVIGTERHESRRIDDQLRGRCGRQGDAGETQFFLSFEDDLTRVFGSERVLSIAKTLKLPENVPIQNKMITNMVERAQKQIEGHHFDARKHSLQYDTILNKQRTEVYEKRRKVLISDDFESYVSKELEEKIKEKAGDEYVKVLRTIILRGIDIAWVDHLHLMEHARSSTGLRSYGQKDPLMEYRAESRNLFAGFWSIVENNVLRSAEEYLSSK